MYVLKNSALRPPSPSNLSQKKMLRGLVGGDFKWTIGKKSYHKLISESTQQNNNESKTKKSFQRFLDILSVFWSITANVHFDVGE